MKNNHQCRWVHRRLPLLAGGELAALERRKVERHLIGCPDCQGRRDASASSLAMLHRFAEESPAKVDAPSLWPSLARQIRQSRHASPPLAWWERPLPRPLGIASMAAALAVLLAASIARPPLDIEPTSSPNPVVVIEEDPVPDYYDSFQTAMAEQPEAAETLSRPRSALPPDPRPGELSQGPLKPIEPPSSILRFDYDLDHGTPMTPGNLDPQRTF